MERPYPLSDLLISALPPTAALRELVPGAALESRLEEICHQARQAWPGVAVTDGAFVQYLAAKADGQPLTDSAKVLADLHTADLYLCCACLLQLPEAVSELDKLIVARLPRQVARMNLSASDLDEVTQRLRQHLLLPRASSPPGVQKYDGLSILNTWLRTVAARVTLDYLEQTRSPDVSMEDDAPAVGEAIARTWQPEYHFIEANYKATIQGALYEAFSALLPDQRRLLRDYFLNGLNTVQLAAKYHIHNANVGRRLHRALEAVRTETERRLGLRFGTESGTIQSLIDLVRSQLHVSIDRVLSESGIAEQDRPPQA